MNKEYLEQLLKEHKSTREIAALSKKSQTAVRYWLKKYGMKSSLTCGHRRRGTPRKKQFFCDDCGEDDPNNFYRSNGRCKHCHNQEQIRRFRLYKKQAVEYKGGKCELCAYDKCQAALDFHHKVRNEKDPRWRLMRCWCFDKLKVELDKCMLVCRNCHAEIHYGSATV